MTKEKAEETMKPKMVVAEVWELTNLDGERFNVVVACHTGCEFHKFMPHGLVQPQELDFD